MPLEKEVSDFVATEMPKYVKAHAIISKEQLPLTHSKTFLKLSMTGLSVNVFTNENEAGKWLKEYL